MFLPSTSSDLQTSSSKFKGKRNKRFLRTPFGVQPSIPRQYKLILIVISFFTVLYYFNPFMVFPKKSNGVNTWISSYSQQRNVLESMKDSPFPLAQLSSLSYALANAEIVVLYFAASWCPMSTPVTQDLEKYFGDSSDVLVPQSVSEETAKSVVKSKLAIVFVSSDRSEKRALKYGSANWIRVPFGSSDETNLKRYFKTCAAGEAIPLNVDRKHGIPNVIVIDAKTHNILSKTGEQDLKDHSHETLDHWNQILSTQ